MKHLAAVVAVVGASGAGKTTVIEGLVRALASRGYRVGVVKHTCHPVEEPGPPGKDTWRCARAGAVSVALAGAGGLLLWRRDWPDLGLGAVCDLMRGVDVVLAEGFSSEPGVPKILVHREDRPLKDVAGPVLAVVGDPLADARVPHYRYTQLEKLAEVVAAEARGR